MGGLTYTDEIYQRLVDLPMGKKIFFDPARKTQEEWNAFTEIVKQFIRDDYGNYYTPKFYIQLSTDGLSVFKFEFFSADKKESEQSAVEK